MILRLLQRHGHRPLVLVDGGTTRIGILQEGRTAQAVHRRTDRCQHGPDRCCCPLIPAFWRWPDRCTHRGSTHRPASARPPPLGDQLQPAEEPSILGADQGLYREHPLTFPNSLHALVKRPFPRAEPPPRRHLADRWLGPMVDVRGIDLCAYDNQCMAGSTLLIATASATWARPARVWCAANQSTGIAVRMEFGATPRMRICRPLPAPVHRPATGGDRPAGGSRRWINEAKKLPATQATRLATAKALLADAAETARLAFEEGEAAATLPSVEAPRSDLAAGILVFRLFPALAGLARQQRSVPADSVVAGRG